MLQTNGYMAATRSTGMPRDIEYQVFCKVTGAINRAAAADPLDFSLLAEALNDNLMLWRTLALDVVDADNGLPDQLRAQLFYLFEFTHAHTRKVLLREAEVAPLIDVNTSIIKGLRQRQRAEGVN